MPVDADLARELVGRVATAVTAKDLDAFSELCTDDVVLVDPAMPAPFHGRGEVLEGLRTIFAAFPDLTYEPVGDPLVSPTDGTIATRVRFTGTMRGALDPPGFAPTNGPIDIEAIEVYTLAADRIRRIELFMDTLGLGRQIAALPPAGSTGDRFGVLVQRLTARRLRRRPT